MQTVEEYYRFCPNKPKLLISDAVCLGRRRASYPYCKGCQFNDDEQGGEMTQTWSYDSKAADERQANMEKIFKAYDVRGTYPDMFNEEMAWRIGFATASYLTASLRGMDRSDQSSSTMVVGRDMRKSSPSMAASFIEGARATGTPVVDIGMIDTPQIYFAINHLSACGGAQITASHNPAHYNGCKISGVKGAPIGGDTGLNDICKIAKNTAKHDSGKQGPLSQRDLSSEYKSFLRGFLEQPKPMKVCVDASNGMAGKWVPIIFGDVPELELITMNMETNGEFVHEPNPLVDAYLVSLQESVRENKADFGICFDGDADRLIVVDENADIVRCDMLTALLAKQFLQRNRGATVVYDLRSSRAVAEEIQAAGGVARRERVGHAFMKKALSESKGVFGGELSGHFYFKDNAYCDSGMLALINVINTLTREKKPMSELIAPLKRYFSSGEKNFQNDKKDETIEEIREKYADGKIDFLDGITVQFEDWWFNVRKSNTEPLLRLNMEANSEALLEEKLAELSPLLGESHAH